MKGSKLEKRAKSNRLKIVPFGSLGWTQSRDELTLAQASETDFQRRKKGHILGVGKQSEWRNKRKITSCWRVRPAPLRSSKLLNPLGQNILNQQLKQR